MSVSRRQILGGAALVGAAGALGVHRLAGRKIRPQVVIYDSARPASLAFARAQPGTRLVDLAGERSVNWQGVRALRKKGGAVAGLTGWNDYVAARQWLEERGLRVQVEDHDRKHDLIAWTMA